jgi:predicted DNA-binding protein
MEVHMELSKKTTILLTPELHARLVTLAKQRGSSIGALIREACERQYGLYSKEGRLAAVREMSQLSLPVGTVRQMKRESVPDPKELAR